jgi:hypothetical protein
VHPDLSVSCDYCNTLFPSAAFTGYLYMSTNSSVPRMFFFGGGGVSTNSAEDRGQTERGSGCSSPLVRGFTQFVNKRNSYSD